MILFLLSDCIIIGLSIFLLYYSKKNEKRTIINEKKDTSKVETIQVFVTKPMNPCYGTVSINTLNTFNKEKVADYFTQKIIEDNLIKINDCGEFYKATITIVKE